MTSRRLRRYVVNVKLNGNQRVAPDGACPAFERPAIEPFVPLPVVDAKTAEPVVVQGAKQRSLASVETAEPRLGAQFGSAGAGAGSRPAVGYSSSGLGSSNPGSSSLGSHLPGFSQ